MELRYSEGGETVYFPADCVIENAAGIKDALVEVLGRKEIVRADVSGVKRLDLSGIQLMYAFLRSGDAAGRRISWTGKLGEEARGALTVSGYSDAMEDYREKAEVSDER